MKNTALIENMKHTAAALEPTDPRYANMPGNTSRNTHGYWNGHSLTDRNHRKIQLSMYLSIQWQWWSYSVHPAFSVLIKFTGSITQMFNLM